MESQNGLKRTVTILSLVAVSLGLLGTFGGVFIKLGKAQERADNLESAVVALKHDQSEMLKRIRATEINTYAIAVKFEIEGIIKPVDK